jgi:hypothetical protein
VELQWKNVAGFRKIAIAEALQKTSDVYIQPVFSISSEESRRDRVRVDDLQIGDSPTVAHRVFDTSRLLFFPEYSTETLFAYAHRGVKQGTI